MKVNQSTVTQRGQTIIPVAIRRELNIQVGDILIWINDGGVLRVVRESADPLKLLFGRGRGEGLNAKLLVERTQERV